MNQQRISAVFFKEWREIFRDRLFFALAFIVPSALMLVFGYGVNLDVERLPFAVLDYDRSAMSRDYSYRFIGSRYFDFKGHVKDQQELDYLLSDSKVRMVLIIPEHFHKQLQQGQPTTAQVLIDGTFPFRATTTKGYVIAITAAVNAELLTEFVTKTQGISAERAADLIRPVHLQLRYLYNQPLRSRWSITAALMMLVLILSPPFLTALGVVREKETGSIYNIYASTITRGEFLIGKLTPYVIISSINIVILWLLVIGLFGTPFKGNPWLFYLASVIYVICTTGIGLLISLMVKTQVAAMMMTAVITYMPSILYSGLIIPISSMESTAWGFAHLFPSMYYTNISLGSFLKGIGLDVLWLDIIILALYATVLWVVGYLLFNKRPKT
jgi:ABC-2 type transport system permease protein/ribosome-dependent ATPase